MPDPTAPVTPLFNVPTGAATTSPFDFSSMNNYVNGGSAASYAPAAVAAGGSGAVDPTNKFVENNPKHQGGAGLARDVLGTIGDFLLTRLHMPEMYAPAQKNRRLAEAQQGYEVDPMGAINRVMSIDPTAGAKLRDQYIDNQRQAALVQSTAETRNSRIALAQEAANQRTRGYAASMMNTLGSWDPEKRESSYPMLRQQVLTAAQRQGLDLSDELPETYDSNALDAFIDGNVPVGTQRSQKLTAEKITDNKTYRDARLKQFDRAEDDKKNHWDNTEDQGQQRITNSESDFQQRNATTIRGQNLTHDSRVQSDKTRQAGQAMRQLKVGQVIVRNGVSWTYNGGDPSKPSSFSKQ